MAPPWAWRRHGTKSRRCWAARPFAMFKTAQTKDQADSTSPWKAKGWGRAISAEPIRLRHGEVMRRGIYAGAACLDNNQLVDDLTALRWWACCERSLIPTRDGTARSRSA